MIGQLCGGEDGNRDFFLWYFLCEQMDVFQERLSEDVHLYPHICTI